MSFFRFVGAAGVVWALFVGGERSAEAAQCALGNEYQVVSVAAYRTTEEPGGYYGDYTHLRGAEVRVAAQPGLTREWLERKLESQVAAGECQFGVDSVDVDVVSGDGSFLVRFESADERNAKEILRRARELAK